MISCPVSVWTGLPSPAGEQVAAEEKGGCLPIIGLVVGVGFLASMCGGSDGGSSDADGYGAESVCEDWVRDQLKAPSTADFDNEEISGSGPWTITGTVDAQNGFGAQMRADWSCDIRLDSDDFYRGGATLHE